MCRGADLGICCALGCDEKIRCQDTGGYCDGHDPYAYAYDEDEGVVEAPPVVDDPEKRRIYTLGRVTSGIKRAEAAVQMSQLSLANLRARQSGLTAPASLPGSAPEPGDNA